MAELTREVVKKYFSIDKANGQTIQLNEVKWGKNSSKCDLRVWDGEKPLKGMTLTGEEAKDLALAMRRIVLKDLNEADQLEFYVTQFELVDLKKIVKEYPECIGDYRKLQGLLRDNYPKQGREVNLILEVMHCGIVGQMLKSKSITNSELKRFEIFMEKEYGTSPRYTAGAVKKWAQALGVAYRVKEKKEPTPLQEASAPVKSEAAPVVKAEPKRKVYRYSQTIYEDENLAVTYQGIYKFDGLFAQGYRIRFFAENKTNKKMRVEAVNIAVNGIVVCQDDVLNSGIDAHRKVVDTVLMRDSNLKAINVTGVYCMNDLDLQFEYSFEGERGKTKTNVIELKPYTVSA